MIRTQGFAAPGSKVLPQHPRTLPQQPFTDGSQTIGTDLLSSLNTTPQMANGVNHNSNHRHNNNASPFYVQQQLPSSYPYMTSPSAATSDMAFSSSPPTAAFPGGFHFPFGGEDSKPLVHFTPPGEGGGEELRARSLSSSKGSEMTNKVTNQAKPSRKWSMNEVMFGQQQQQQQQQQRGRPLQLHPRAMSQNQGDLYRAGLGLGLGGLETHHKDKTTEPMSAVSAPSWGGYGLPIPRRQSMNGPLEAYGSHGSAPPLITGSSFNSDEAALLDRSPYTPARSLMALGADLSAVDAKRQKRRASHNAVEKRRREHINVQIDRLATIVPSEFKAAAEAEEDENTAGSPMKKKKGKHPGTSDKLQKDPKGAVLSGSVKYIYHLQYQNAEQSARIQQLEQALAGAGQSIMLPPPSQVWTGSGNDNTHSFPHFPGAGIQQLQVMRPSPEPENYGSNNNQLNIKEKDWQEQLFTSTDDMSFGDSYPRSNSLSVSDSGRDTGSDNHRSASSQIHSPDEELSSEKEARAVQENPLLSATITRMDIDSFEGKTDQENGGMRW